MVTKTLITSPGRAAEVDDLGYLVSIEFDVYN